MKRTALRRVTYLAHTFDEEYYKIIPDLFRIDGTPKMLLSAGARCLSDSVTQSNTTSACDEIWLFQIIYVWIIRRCGLLHSFITLLIEANTFPLVSHQYRNVTATARFFLFQTSQAIPHPLFLFVWLDILSNSSVKVKTK